MGKYKIVLLLETVILLAVLFAFTSCTSLSEGSQTGELITEPERRVRLEGDATATIRDRMDEQASEINRKKNIEETRINEPAMTPPDLRPQLVPNAPIDSAVHNNTEWLTPAQFKSRLIIRS